MDYSRRTFLKYVTVVSVISSFNLLDKELYAQETITFIIPDQYWPINRTINIDLMDFISGPVAAEVTFSINKPLPDYVYLNGNIISGTPSIPFSEGGYIVTMTSVEKIPNSPTLISVV